MNYDFLKRLFTSCSDEADERYVDGPNLCELYERAGEVATAEQDWGETRGKAALSVMVFACVPRCCGSCPGWNLWRSSAPWEALSSMNRAALEVAGSDMNPIPEKYADTPNFYRPACELKKFRDPYGACDMLLRLAGPMLKQGDKRKEPT